MKQIKHLFLLALLCGVVSAYAQQGENAAPPRMTAAMTEVWSPQPGIVTPGSSMDAIVSAPSDAIVLFDGTSLDEWEMILRGELQPANWEVKEGAMWRSSTLLSGTLQTKRSFGDCQLHVEWMIPVGTEGVSQRRGNSGVNLQSRYEVQILDSYNNETYVNGQAASIYKQHPPLVNAMNPQGRWNVYDIIYTAPRFKEDGSLHSHATMTILHNGVLVQNHSIVLGRTVPVGIPSYEAHGKAPLQLYTGQVAFRNIWIREL
jgi:hypothetical protein